MTALRACSHCRYSNRLPSDPEANHLPSKLTNPWADRPGGPGTEINSSQARRSRGSKCGVVQYGPGTLDIYLGLSHALAVKTPLAMFGFGLGVGPQHRLDGGAAARLQTYQFLQSANGHRRRSAFPRGDQDKAAYFIICEPSGRPSLGGSGDFETQPILHRSLPRRLAVSSCKAVHADEDDTIATTARVRLNGVSILGR